MTNVLQSTISALRSLIFSVGTLLRNGWQLLVWEDVRAGSIDLKGTPRSFRLLMRLGMWLTILLLVGMMYTEGWRNISPLQPLTFYNDHLAGLLIPAWIVPIVFGILSIAWAYLLTGALHAPWYAKGIVLLLFGMFDYNLMLSPVGLFWGEIQLLMSGFTLAQVGLWNTAAVVITTGAWLFLFIFFLLRWGRPERPGLEFPIILLTMTLMMFAAYFGVQFGNGVMQTQETVSGLQLTTALEQINNLLNPFLAIAGVEIILLGMALTKTICTPLQKRAQPVGQRGWALALGVFLLFRLGQDWLWPLLTGGEIYFSWGAILMGLVIVPVLLLGFQTRAAGDLPGWVIPGMAVLFSIAAVFIEIGYLGFGTLAILFVTVGNVTTGNQLLDLLSTFFNALAEWNAVLIGLFAGFIGMGLSLRALLKRQPLPMAVFYLFLFILWLIGWTLTRTGRPLESLYFQYEHLTAVSTWFLAGFFGVALMFRRLTPRVLLTLTGAALIFWLMNFRSYLDDPFSPLFAWLGAQAALTSFSIFLNVMNAGNRFNLNHESAQWPRMTRGLLYFGYALLTVINMFWLIVGHQADALATNQLYVNIGFGLIGIPLVLWAIVTGNTGLFGQGSSGD